MTLGGLQGDGQRLPESPPQVSTRTVLPWLAHCWATQATGPHSELVLQTSGAPAQSERQSVLGPPWSGVRVMQHSMPAGQSAVSSQATLRPPHIGWPH